MANSGQFKKGDSRIYNPKVSGLTSGAFKKGYNPTRHQPKGPTLAERMRGRTSEALAIIDYFLNAPFSDRTVSNTLRLKAATLCLEYGHGKPQDAGTLALTELTPDQVKDLTLPELLSLAAQDKPGNNSV